MIHVSKHAVAAELGHTQRGRAAGAKLHSQHNNSEAALDNGQNTAVLHENPQAG